MGVTLERVQNKFACIIGELCNEPIILSQFAIWVDLRIAEFKTKGAISLDCSGDEPEPDWMNGHRLPKRRGDNSGLMNRHSRHQQKFQPMGGGPASDTGFLNEGRLSPEFLLIKEEGLTSHEHDVHRNRKRSLTQTVSQPDDTFYHQDPSLSSPSAAKMKRFSSSGESAQPTTTETTSNQSLMSIISGGLDTSTQNQSSTDISASDIDVILDFENSSSSVQKSTNNQGPTSVMPEAGPSTSFDADNSFNRDNNISEQITVAGISVPGAESVRKVAPEAGIPAVERFRNYRWQTTKPPIGSVTKEEMEERLSNNVIRTRVYPGDKTSQTILDIVNSVSSIERWMWVNRGETRFVETIPPEELDAMLVDYFMTLRKPTGEDYKVDSFGKMRSCLERFLRDCRYPVSLRKSAVFGRSQNAYDMRRKAIMLQCFEKTGQDGPGFYGL